MISRPKLPSVSRGGQPTKKCQHSPSPLCGVPALLAADVDDLLEVWSLETGTLLAVLQHEWTRRLFVDTRRRLLLSLDPEATAIMVRPLDRLGDASGRIALACDFEPFLANVTASAMSPDGSLILAGWDGVFLIESGEIDRLTDLLASHA